MLCRKCGVEVPHVCAPEQLVGRAVVDCPIHKGAIWVQVTGQGGAGLEGVSVHVDRVDRTLPTDPTGFLGFDPLDENDYVVELTAVPGALTGSYALPALVTSPAPVRPGEITFLSFALAPRIAPRITLSKAVVGVGGARITVKLEAQAVAGGVSPFPGKGTGTLTVAQGVASIKLYREGVEVVLGGNAITFDTVPADGITLAIEAVDHSAFEGITLQWKLASVALPVAADAVSVVLTAVRAELVAKTKLGTVLSADVKHGVGGVVHLQNVAGTRARLEVTPRVLPPEVAGQLRLAAIKANIAVYDADTAGNLVDLATPIDVGPAIAPLYVQGNTVSDPVADTGLTLALVDVIDRADELKLTVVKVTLGVYGGTPGPSDPAVLLTDPRKLDPGRRLYVQETTNWWWGRAKVRLTKNPPDAPCKLSLRQAGGAGAIRLFPETGGAPVAGSLDVHREGEAAVVLPRELAVDALPDAVAGIVYWAEGVTAAADARNLFVDLVDVEQGCEQAAFRVLQPLDEFQRISVIDLGGPGTGHQAAVLKLLASLASVGFGGEVVLSYNTKKTRIYANAFGRAAALAHPVQSYALYHAEWAGVYPAGGGGRHQLNIRCLPVGRLDIVLTAAQTRVFTDVQTFWTQYAWPNAAPGPFAGPKPGGFGAALADWSERSKWTSSNAQLATEQTKWRQAKVYDQETGAAMAPDTDLVELAPVVARTLTAFGAMDFHANDAHEAAQPGFKAGYFDHHWLPVMRTMTREQHPVAMSFQPFLWTGGHPMQVRQDTIIAPVDVIAKVVAAGGKPVYRLVPADPAGDDGVIGALPDVPRTVLTNAKAGNTYLVSAYYGAPVSDIQYDHFLRVMVRVIKALAPNRPVVVALIGDDMKDAHTTVAGEAQLQYGDGSVIARTNAAVSGLDVEIELAHIGRTTAMTQFQRYSKLFVTEGANTWQEVLSIGTPSLSVKPAGNTRPWEENPPAVAGADAVRDASLALIAAQDPTAAGDHATLRDFLRDALDPGSDVVAYFAEWRRLLADPHSDQVVTAVNYLPDPADNV